MRNLEEMKRPTNIPVIRKSDETVYWLIAWYNNKPVIKDIYTDEEEVVELTEITYL